MENIKTIIEAASAVLEAKTVALSGSDFDVKAIEKSISSFMKKAIGNDPKISISYNKKTDKFEGKSGDLSKGMKPKMFKSLVIQTEGSHVSTNPDVRNLRISVSYRYDHFDGGSNGFGIADMYFNEAGKMTEVNSKLGK